MEKKDKTELPKKKRVGLIILNVTLALVLVALISGSIYIESRLGLINRKDPANDETMSSSEMEDYLNQTEDNTDFTGETLDPSDVTWDPDPTEPPEPLEDIIHILLIGQDRREGEGRARSDAMILCTINTKAKTLTMTSFMRDLYVQIPGYKDNRINASYAFGGMTLLDATLEKNFGVMPDGNIEVDFNGFMDVIDLLGGVEIELTKSEASYLNRRGNWDVSNDRSWNLKAGVNTLTGSQALAYSRIRAVGNGDFGRTNRQRTVLSALMEKAKGLSLLELDNLLVQILPLLTTDMTNAQILNYTTQLLPMLSELEVNTLQIPAEGAYKMAMIRGMSVLVPTLEKNRKILENTILGVVEGE